MCALVKSKCAIEREVTDADVQRAIFFKVIDENPGSKKLVTPSHIATSGSTIAIATFIALGKPTRAGAFVRGEAGVSVTIDLRALDMLALAKDLVVWECHAFARSAMRLPLGCRAALENIDQVMVPGPQPRVGADGVYRPVPDGHVYWAECIAEELYRRKAFASDGSFVIATELDTTSALVMDVLHKYGVLETCTNEFGEEMVALVGGGVEFGAALKIEEPVFCLGLPLRSPLSDATKLELLVQLIREGWETADMIMQPLLPDSERVVSLNMIIRSKKYLECLIEAEVIFSKGSPMICHQKPELYYACLFVVRDLQSFHSLPRFDSMGNKDFKKILELQGELPEEAMLAIEDGAIAADEDPSERARPALADAFAPPQPLPPPQSVALSSFIGEALAGVDAMRSLRPILLRGCTIRFDNWSHTSGVLRAYTKCAEETHRACFRYSQVTRYGTVQEVIAYLIGWWEMGAGRDRAAHQDPSCMPSAARMAEIVAELPVGAV